MSDRLDRNRLPALDAYCLSRGITWRSGRGREQRYDCPLAEHSHRGNLAVNVEKGVWQCLGGCGAGDVLELHMRLTGASFLDAARELGALPAEGDAPAAPPQLPRRPQPAGTDEAAELEAAARKAERAAAIWRASQTIVAGTPAHEYLVGRGCALPPPDGDLRWMPDLRLYALHGPALVGRMSLAADARVTTGLHITFLQLDGGRWRRTERRYLGPKGGAVVRLWPAEAVDLALGIGEGIETCLAAAHAFRPVWAALDAGNLAAFPVLDGIESLTIFADHDESGAGQDAASRAADRWLRAHRDARVLMPADAGRDVADEVAGC